MNGALIVDKPAGPTSHDVVARVRRALAIRRIGHTGTLDPLATGVLPLLIGRATRLAQFLARDDKAYVAGIRLGRATPTYDAEDRVPPAGPADSGRLAAAIPPVTEPELREALLAFHGTFEQTPPPFSAKKVGGTAAYVLARRREPVEVRPVPVTVRELTLTSYADGLATVHVVCSSGFYVRSLAHDVGQRLGCGAHLESLRRLRAGAFTIEQAVPLTAVEEGGEQVRQRVLAMSALLPELPRVVVNDRGARRVAHGNALGAVDIHPGAGTPPAQPGGRHVCVLDANGALLAVGESLASGLLQPVVVLV